MRVRLEGSDSDGAVRDAARHVQPPHPAAGEPKEIHHLNIFGGIYC